MPFIHDAFPPRRLSRFLTAAFVCVWLLMLGSASTASAQDVSPSATGAPQFGSLGNDFILGFIEASGNPKLWMTAPEATSVRIEYPVGTTLRTVNLAPGQITVVSVSGGATNWGNLAEVKANAVRAVSTDGKNFATYLFVSGSDAALGLPVASLGRDYYVFSWGGFADSPSEFLVVATEDNTTVDVTPTAPVAGRSSAPFTVKLNRGEGFLAQTAKTQDWNLLADPAKDLTGSKVSADKPVLVAYGHKCANVPKKYCDTLFETATPVSTWGTRHVVSNLPARAGGSIYRIISATDGNVVKQDGAQIAQLNRGQFHTIDPLPGNHLFECSQPCAVVHYLTGNASDGTTFPSRGDASISNAVPVDQFLTTYTFTTADDAFFDVRTGSIKENYVQIFAADGDVQAGNVRLDGSVIPAAEFVSIPGSGFSVVTKPINVGAHTTTSVAPHGIQVFGWDYATAYFYAGGLLAIDLDNVFKVTPAVAGPGGALQPSSAQYVNRGQTFVYTVEPLPGFAVASVTGCGGSLSANKYTTAPFTASCTVTATFAVEPAEFGDAPESYGTTLSANGPSHKTFPPFLKLGDNIDIEANVLPGANADGDDTDKSPDDEDAVGALPALTTGASSYSIPNISANNNSRLPVTLSGWIDFNGNGTFDATERASAAVQPGDTTASLTWSGLTGLKAGDTYLRLRFSPQGNLTAVGPGNLGEVEDHKLAISDAGTIVIKKVTVGSTTGSSFAFTDTIAAPNSFTVQNGQSKTFLGVKPGTYTVAEQDPSGVGPGYVLTGLRCDDGGSTQPSTVDLSSRTATISVEGGETVTCEFTNSEDDHIIIEKVTVPAGASGFNFAITDTVGASAPFALSHGARYTKTVATTGVYTITEQAPPAGWDFSGIVCAGGGSASITGSSVALTLNSLNGTAAHCTFTNTQRGKIILNKETLPDGDTQSFTFAATGPEGPATIPALQDGGTATIANAKPGSWTIAETIPSGWLLSDLTCTSLLNNSVYTPTLSSGNLAIDLKAGDTVECTFTNGKAEHITINKVVVPTPQSGGPSFSFDKPEISLKDGERYTRDLAPGVGYSVIENDPVSLGYVVTDITCEDNQGGTSFDVFVAKRQVDFTGAPGLVASCTFTNTLLGTIVIEKETFPALGASFAFSTNVPVPGYPNLVFDLRNGESRRIDTVVPGQYQITESWPGDDVRLSNITCDDAGSATPSVPIPDQRTATVNVDPGETVTCRFTNAAKNTIIIRKETRPAGDATTDFNFTTDLPGGNFTLNSGGVYSVSTAIPGQPYTVTEADPAPGYELADLFCRDTGSGQTFQGDLGARSITITPEANQVLDCTFVNQKLGKIIVEKVVLPAPNSARFDFGANFGTPGTFNLGNGQSQTFTAVKPGSYTVEELTVAANLPLADIRCTDSDQTGTASSGNPATKRATINLDPDETVTCRFTSSQADLVWIEKLTDPAGDVNTAFSFTTNLPGGNFTLKDQAFHVVPNVTPGQPYTVTEVNVPANYDLAGLACFDTFSNARVDGDVTTGSVSFTPEPGHLIYCVFGNTRRSTVTIAKATLPAGSDSFGFTLNGAGGPYTRSVAAGAPQVVRNLEPGAYTLVEEDATVRGYDLVRYSCDDGRGNVWSSTTVTATVNLDPGANVTCTYANVKRGQVTVRQSITDGPAGPVEYELVGASGVVTFTLGNNGEYVAGGLVSGGAYDISQVTPQGSAIASVTCVDGDPAGTPSQTTRANGRVGAQANVDPGETVTCTFVNASQSTILYFPYIGKK